MRKSMSPRDATPTVSRPPLRLDLGVRALWPRWRALVSPVGLREDLIAGINVALVAVPLSMAIALSAGVSPDVALMTSIVAGVVCALFAGTELAVSGPAAALSVITATIVLDHGYSGLLFVGLTVGALQLLTGVFGLGRLIRYVPLAVVHGFTVGMGLIIMVAEIPRALGLHAPDEHHLFDVLSHLLDYVAHTKVAALALAASSIAIMLGVGRFAPRMPALLFAVVIPGAAAKFLALDVELLSVLPHGLPQPSIPAWPTSGAWELLGDALVVFAIASFETLLSSRAVDKMTPQDQSDHDQEILSQGLGNLAVAVLGGIVVSGVIFRSSINVTAGAKTRRAAIIHALFVLLVVMYLAPIVRGVPVAVLAGVLLGFGYRMVSTAPLRALWKVSRVDAAVMVFTALAIVVLDLAAGVQYGIAAALVIAAIGLGRPSTDVHEDDSEEGVRHFSVAGPLTFLAAGQLDRLRNSVEQLEKGTSVVMSLGGVTSIDASGAECIVDLVASVHSRGGKIALLSLRRKPRAVLLAAEPTLAGCIANQMTDAQRIIGRDDLAHSSRLVLGVRSFHRELRRGYEPLLQQLGSGQSPHTLFITCADSRINPNLFTGTDPGELFIIRNIGNLVPRHGDASLVAEAAGIEYAIGVLGAQEVVVCGHSGCGAVGALLGGKVPEHLTHVADWKRHADSLFGGHGFQGATDEASRANVLKQLEHLKQYPVVQEGLAKGELRLHGWFYDVGHGTVSAWDAETQTFEVVGADPTNIEQGGNVLNLIGGSR